MKTVRQFLSHSIEPPYGGSVPIINAILTEVLNDLGYQTSRVARVRNRNAPEIADWLPLPSVRDLLRLRSEPQPDLEIRDNTSFHLFPAPRRGRHKNVVLFHALIGNGEQWFANEAVDRYWANSDYIGRVLTSFLAMPDWAHGRLADARAFSAVGTVTLPLPYLDMPQEQVVAGPQELPPAVLAALDGKDILGHCVTRKLDQRATYSILLGLNEMSLRAGDKRRFRLLVEPYLFDGLQQWLGPAAPADLPAEFQPLKGYLAQLGLTLEDIMLPVPRLAQSAMFKLLSACSFGLQYHWNPEPFGLFPLESICHGCPVYTNGAGNLRYLLPEGHGINVLESEEMVFGSPAAYAAVAQRIFHDTVVDPEPARAACRRGAEVIAATYNRQMMARDLQARIAELDHPAAEHGLDSTRFVLSPLVRSWNPATRRVISDWKSVELSTADADLVGTLLGQRCGDLDLSRQPATLATVDRLIDQAILTLLPA